MVDYTRNLSKLEKSKESFRKQRDLQNRKLWLRIRKMIIQEKNKA